MHRGGKTSVSCAIANRMRLQIQLYNCRSALRRETFVKKGVYRSIIETMIAAVVILMIGMFVKGDEGRLRLTGVVKI